MRIPVEEREGDWGPWKRDRAAGKRDGGGGFAVLRRNNNSPVVVYEISELRGSRPARRKAARDRARQREAAEPEDCSGCRDFSCPPAALGRPNKCRKKWKGVLERE